MAYVISFAPWWMSKFVMNHWKNRVIYIFVDPIVQNPHKERATKYKNNKKMQENFYLGNTSTKQSCFPKNK
jgi:hypothetical protein